MNVFLDCGTHFGQGLDTFVSMFNIDKNWHVESYEANPVTFAAHMPNRKFDYVKYKNIGIFDKNSELTFNIETPPNEGDTGMGSSFMDLSEWNPWGGQLRPHFQKKATVPCIDLSEHIKKSFSKDDFLVCKMDIEGSEYCVLEKIIQEDLVDYFKVLFVEFHSSFFTNKDEMLERELKIKQKFLEKGIKINSWG